MTAFNGLTLIEVIGYITAIYTVRAILRRH